MKSEDKDWIETRMQNAFKDFNPSVPPDSWQNISEKINARRSRRKFLLWLQLTSVGLFLFLCIAYSASTIKEKLLPISHLNNLYSSYDSSIYYNSLSLSTSKNLIIENSEPELTNKILKTKLTIKTRNIQSHFNLEQISNQKLNHSKSQASEQEIRISDNLNFISTRSIEEKGNCNLNDSSVRVHSETLLPIRKLFKIENNILSYRISNSFIQRKNKKKLPLWISLHYSYSQSIEKAPIEIANVNNYFFEHELSVPKGNQFGIGISWMSKSQWRFSLGINRQYTVLHGSHTALLNTRDGIILNPNDSGLKNYQFNYNLISGNENTRVSLRLDQQDINSTMPLDEPFSLEMMTTKSNVSYNFPIAVENHFGSGRLNAFLIGGLALNIKQNSKFKVSHYSESCRDLCFTTEHNPTITNTNTFVVSYSYLLGAGIEWKLTSNIRLVISPMISNTFIYLHGNGSNRLQSNTSISALIKI
ncbi:MAG: hypothetical protein ABIO44_04970 [Saprospiraceae bacterium]